MGMIIKTFLAPDEYGGRGIFSDQPVKKGDLVWKYEEASTKIYTIEEYKRALANGTAQPKYCYPVEMFENGKMVRYVYDDLDEGRHMNHSTTPNTGMIPDPSHPHYKDRDYLNMALRDISPGEQLTYDYFDFVTKMEDWLDVETCMQFLIDADPKYKIA